MKYPVHLCVESKIPYYFKGKNNFCKQQIQEIMYEYDYDEDFINAIDEEFCKGFGVARDIILEFLKEKYWSQQENPIKEITMDKLEEHFGCKVKIVK